MTDPLGWGAIANGIEDENTVAVWLMRRGWGVSPFGQRMWDPRTCALYGATRLIEAARRTRRPIKHGPDLITGRDDIPDPWLIEVYRNGRDTGNRCMEVEKLLANDVWCHITPVWYVDVGHRTTWPHRLMWSRDAVDDVTRRTKTGSGDPYAWFRRTDERPFNDIFGMPDQEQTP